jgi:hypothetical protein
VPLTVLAILVAYLIGRRRTRRGAATTAAQSVGAQYENRADVPPGQPPMGMPPQQGGMVVGGVSMGDKADAKIGMVPMYATPPSSLGSPPSMMIPGYAPPPQGYVMPPQELDGGQYMAYPQGPYEVGAQTPAVAQAVQHQVPQQNTVYEAPG